MANPNFGLVFLVATVAFAWAVAEGSLRWWPVMVVSGSVAAQSHLFYLFPAMALVISAPLIAIALLRPRRYRWLGVGLALGALCWLFPIGQELFGNPGNISVLLSGKAAHTGIGFGLRTLSMAGSTHPIWLSPFPYFVAIANGIVRYINRFSAAWGVIVVLLTIAVTVIAWWRGLRSLAIVATIGAILALTTIVTFSSFPAGAELGATVYLIPLLWLVGTILWIVFIWAAAEVVVAAWQPRTTLAIVFALLALGVVTAKGTTSVYDGAMSKGPDLAVVVPVDSSIAHAVERSVSRKPTVLVSVNPAVMQLKSGPLRTYAPDLWGIGWLLVADGWRPALPSGQWANASGLTLPKGVHWRTAVVQLQQDRLVLSGVRIGQLH